MIDTGYLKEFNGNKGISDKELETLPIIKKLPNDYIDFLKLSNGGEGFIGNEYIILYKIEELEGINNDYEILEFDSDLLIIGSNGGSEAIALDFIDNKTKYVLIPFLFDRNDIIELGEDFRSFLEGLFTKGYFTD